jgi:hypothetical protein
MFVVESGELQHLCSAAGRLFVCHRDAGTTQLLTAQTDGAGIRSLTTAPPSASLIGKVCAGETALFWTYVESGDLDDVTCLMRTAVDGSQTERLANADGASCRRKSFAVHSDDVYWAHSGGGPRQVNISQVVGDAGLRPVKQYVLAGSSPGVACFRKGSVAPKTIALSCEARTLATDGRWLFHFGAEATADGSREVLNRTALDGGETHRLTEEDGFGAQMITVVGDQLIWTRAAAIGGEAEVRPAAILRTPLTGGPTEILSHAVGTIDCVTTSNGELFWLDIEKADNAMSVRGVALCRTSLTSSPPKPPR